MSSNDSVPFWACSCIFAATAAITQASQRDPYKMPEKKDLLTVALTVFSAVAAYEAIDSLKEHSIKIPLVLKETPEIVTTAAVA